MTLVALYFLINAQKLKKNGMNEIVGMIFTGRSMLILMGVYAMYVGFLYNDQFSLGVDWFGTTWSFPEGGITGKWSGRVYPMGLDPIWHDKANSLLFYNSFKMKFAVIFRYRADDSRRDAQVDEQHLHAQLGGLLLRGHSQMIFMLSFFGWMIVLIVVKWLIVPPRAPPHA